MKLSLSEKVSSRIDRRGFLKYCAVGDVIPFYWKGEYHVFYLLNATGNYDINWEHTVSTDLVHWKELEPALRWDPSDPTGPDGGDDVYRQYY